MIERDIYIFTSRSPDFGGGVEKVSKEIGYGLYNSGKFNVNFVFPGSENKTENKNGINYITIKNTVKIPFFNEIILNLKLIKFFRKLDKNDIVLNNGFSPVFYLLFHKKRFKLVHICHGTLHGSIESMKFWGVSLFKRLVNVFYAKMLDIFVKYVVKKSDLVVTLSKHLKEELIQHYHIDKNKIAIIYNGCDMNYSELKNHDKSSYLSVVFTGADYGRKGLSVLEGVAQKLKNEKIMFKIIGVDSYEPMLENITSLGRLKREDVYKNMENSDIIFLPSYYEGQPLVLLEAMSFGCIPVYSKACHMDMLETTKFNDFVSKKNLVDDYVHILKNILELKDIDEYRKFAKEFVSKYTWDNQVEEYINLFNKL